MITRTCVRLYAWLLIALDAAVRRVRTAPQTGQGTVEYVALVLLVAAVMAAAIAAVGGTDHFNVATAVTDQLKAAIHKVGGGTSK